MTTNQNVGPVGVLPMSGVVHQRSPVSVAETVLRLTAAIRSAGSLVYFVIDHSGEAHRAGAELRDTKLIGFGNPAVDASAMADSPLAALDLPVRVLVWSDEDEVWITYADPVSLTERYGLTDDLATSLTVVDQVTNQLTTTDSEP